MIKRLDLYLLRYFLMSMIVVTLAVGLTIVVINMVEQVRDFIDNQVPILKILEYYLYFGGWVIKAFTPMFVMLAILFTISILARRFEVLAMKASGLSLYRIAYPLLAISLVVSVGHFYYSEYLFPPANQKRVEIKEFTIEKRSRKAFAIVRNVYRQISPGHFYTIGKFDVDRQEGDDLKVYKTDENRLQEILIARQVNYRNHRWIARDGIIRYFDDSAKESYAQIDSLVLMEIGDKPSDLAKRLGKPEDMGVEALRQYIDLMRRTGGPFLREQIDLKIKYAFPMTSFIVALICIPFAANPRRGGIAVSFALGAVIALVYFVLFRVTQSAGYNEKIPQELAVWGVNGLFLLVGLVSMLKARK
ncbi:MAG: LptF/LptG family permease [Candidatus Zixiibacteriota bacterium]|nr:MAG: LptF/LptG family permease [candidate division Zixibacteria bacterium]